VLKSFLTRTIRRGDLTLKLPGGRSVTVGDETGPRIVARIRTAEPPTDEAEALLAEFELKAWLFRRGMTTM